MCGTEQHRNIGQRARPYDGPNTTTPHEKTREVYLADGQPSPIGPITHTAKVPMDIGSHREKATFQVARLPNYEVILRMPWLKQPSHRINWGQGKIPFKSDPCPPWCLKNHQPYTQYQKRKREQRTSKSSSAQLKARMIRGLELGYSTLRQNDRLEDRQRWHDTTCRQTKKGVFRPADKKLS